MTVLEADTVGSGASWGNGGWLCPAQAGPLPEPGLTWYGIRSLFDRSSALYFKFSKLPQLTPWLLRFWTYCNARDHEHGVESLAVARPRRLRPRRRDARRRRRVRASPAWACWSAARKAETAREELAKLQPMRAYGYELPDDILDLAKLHEIEPALADDIAGGFEVRQHWHVRPDSFTAGIADELREMGVEIVEGAEVSKFEVSAGIVTSVRTAKGDHPADAFLLAAGSWTTPLAKLIGVRFPMQAGKGYSFFVKPSVLPSHSILLADVHVGCTPLGDRDADRRDDGVQRPQHATSTSAGSTTSSPRPAARSSRGTTPEIEAEVGGDAADHRRRPADPRPDRAHQHLRLNRRRDAGRHARAAGREGDGQFITTGSRPQLLEPFGLERLQGLRRRRNGRG